MKGSMTDRKKRPPRKKHKQTKEQPNQQHRSKSKAKSNKKIAKKTTHKKATGNPAKKNNKKISVQSVKKKRKSKKPHSGHHPKRVRVIPLGGVEEVGCNLLAFEIGNDIIISDIGFEFVKDYLPFQLAPDTSGEDSASKFGELKGNWLLFFSIMPFVLVQSALEELLDRGFLITWIERVFSSTSAATIFGYT